MLKAERRLANSDDSPAMTGEVYLVGAGPGDPDLLTVRALRLLQAADCIVHDRLIGPEILDLARDGAECHYVGKARDNHSRSQQQINDLMLERARDGQRVLRLKGGDPLIFGRGGEEIEFLQAAGVQVHVVPGITAASGCAAYAGIPLTHRELAHSCVFLTGHFSDESTDLDWHKLTQPGQTLVFYMGVYNLRVICARLLTYGMPPDTPVAVVQNGSLPEQSVTTSSLGALHDQPRLDHSSPGLVIVGDTVRRSPFYIPQAIDDACVAMSQ